MISPIRTTFVMNPGTIAEIFFCNPPHHPQACELHRPGKEFGRETECDVEDSQGLLQRVGQHILRRSEKTMAKGTVVEQNTSTGCR